jgi:hypothetical protein
MTSQDRVFSIIGDSNVRRFNTHVNQRACSDLSKAQVVSCGKIHMLPEALAEVRSEVDACIVSCVSNFVCDTSSDASSVSVRVEGVIDEFRKFVSEACSLNPNRMYLVCPPMYRRSPLWYRDGLSEILNKFSSIMSSKRVSNLILLPSFARPELDPDGIHLTQYSGLEFLFHLFDSSKAAISQLKKSSEDRHHASSEAIRALEDRMMASEQDHKRLNSSFEAKMAVDAELADFQENVRNEVFFVVSGLPRIPLDLKGRDWQTRAISDVRKLIQTLLDKDLPIVVVQNVTGRGSDVPTRYHVKMEFAAHSQEVRSKFGSYFVGKIDRRPEALKGVSISNRITPGTQVRILVLRLLASRYEKSNPGGRAKVIGYESRPIIRITPPSESTDKRVKTFTYMEAIRYLPTCFTKAEVQPILAKIDPKFRGKLRSTFVVLSDDDYTPINKSSRNKRGPDSDSVDAPEPKR